MASRGGRKVILSNDAKRASSSKKSTPSVFDRLGAQPSETPKSGSHIRLQQEFTPAAQSDQRSLTIQAPRRTLKIPGRSGERRDIGKAEQTAGKDIEESKSNFGEIKLHFKPLTIEKQAGKDKLVKGRTRSCQSFKDLSDISDDETSENRVKTTAATKSLASKPTDYRDLSPVSDNAENRKDSRHIRSGRLRHRDSSEPESKQPKLMTGDETKVVLDKQESRERITKGDLTDNSGKRKLKLMRLAHSAVQESKSEIEENPRKKPKLMTTSDYKRDYEQDLSKLVGAAGRDLSRSDKLKHRERISDEEPRAGKDPNNDSKKDHQQKSKSKEEIPEREKSKGRENKEKDKTDRTDKQEKSAREERNVVTGDTEWRTKGGKAKKDRDKAEKGEQGKLDKTEREDRGDRDESIRPAKANRDKGTKMERLQSTTANLKDDKQEKRAKAERLDNTATKLKDDKQEKSTKTDRHESTAAKLKNDKQEKEKVEKVTGEKSDRAGKEEKSSKDDRRDKDKRDKDRSDKEGRSDREGRDKDRENKDRDRGEKERRDKDKEGRDKDKGKKDVREVKVDKDRGEREDKESSQGNRESRDKDRVEGERRDDITDKGKGDKEVREKSRLDRDGRDKDRERESREKERSDKAGRERDRGFKDKGEKNGQEVSKPGKDGKEKDRRDKDKSGKEGRDDKVNKDAKDNERGNNEGKEKVKTDKESKEKDKGQSDDRDRDRGDKERKDKDKVEKDVRGTIKIDKDRRDRDKGKEGHSKGKHKDRDSSSRERTRLTPMKESTKDVSSWEQGKKDCNRVASSDFEKISASPDPSRIRRSKRPRSSPSSNSKSSKRRRQESPTQADSEELQGKLDTKQTKSNKSSPIGKADVAATELGNGQERIDTKKSVLGEREVAGTAASELARKETTHVLSREKIDVDVIDEVIDHAAYGKEMSSVATELSVSADKNTAATSHGKKSQEKAKEKDKDKEKKERSKERSKEKDKSHTDRDLSEKVRDYKKTSGSRHDKNEDSRHKEREGRRDGHPKVRAVGDRDRSSYRSRRDRSKEQSNHRDRERERRDGESEKDRKDSTMSTESASQKDSRDSRPGVGSAPQTDEELETLSDTGSDAFLDEETKAKEKQCQLLESMPAGQQLLVGIDWASLHTGKREAMVGDFTHRMSPAAVFSRIGVSAALAGDELFQRIQKISSSQSGDDSKRPSCEDHTQKSVLGSYGLNGQLLTARRDMALRAKLRQLPNQGPHTSQPPPVDTELYQMALSIYRQQEDNGADDETTKSTYKLVHSKVGSLLVKA